MAAETKHPHLDMPSEKELARVIGEVRPTQRDLYLAVHRLVTEALPGVRYSVDRTDAGIGYGARQYGYDGWGLAGLTTHRAWLSLVLFRGTALKDPNGLLEGTGSAVRHIKIRSLDELGVRREGIRALLQGAANFGKR